MCWGLCYNQTVRPYGLELCQSLIQQRYLKMVASATSKRIICRSSRNSVGAREAYAPTLCLLVQAGKLMPHNAATNRSCRRHSAYINPGSSDENIVFIA